MDWIDYREKLGIGFCDEEKIKFLQVIVENHFATIEEGVSLEDYFAFCNMTGTAFNTSYNNDWDAKGRFILIWRTILNRFDTLESFLSFYIAFLNTYKNPIPGVSFFNRENYKNILLNLLNEAHIPYSIIEENENYFVFPKGVQEFDDALVSQPLEWLSDYPNAETAWSKALRDYAEATDDNASDVADKFRKGLETFFQEFFGGSKSLENYKSAYGDYLKQRNVPKEISSNFETVLQSYTNYMNNYAKHRDRTSDTLLEYIMYQTGNIIRLLIVLKQEETANAH